MLKTKWTRLETALTAIVSLSLIFLVFELVPLYRDICSVPYQSAHEECSRYHLAKWTVLTIIIFLDTHNGLVTAIATIFVAGFTWTLWRSGDAAARTAGMSAEHFRLSERAYFQLSHRSGIRFFPEEGKIRVAMQVKNCGKTPGTVTYQLLGPIVVRARDGKLVSPPDYSALKDARTPETFLIPDGLYKWDIGFEFKDEGIVEAIEAGEFTLFLIGYVDYKDQFGGRHRSGYARIYVPRDPNSPQGNNLSYPTASGFNYDRERIPGEGVDWD